MADLKEYTNKFFTDVESLYVKTDDVYCGNSVYGWTIDLNADNDIYNEICEFALYPTELLDHYIEVAECEFNAAVIAILDAMKTDFLS